MVKNSSNSIKKNMPFYIMFIPVFIYFVVFRYVPLLLSLIISIQKYQPAKGILTANGLGWIITDSLLILFFSGGYCGIPWELIFCS